MAKSNGNITITQQGSAWVASCDEQELELDSDKKFTLTVTTPGWTFDGSAAQPTPNSGYTDQTNMANYKNVGTTGVWVYDPDGDFSLRTDNRSDPQPKVGIKDDMKDNIEDHHYLVCLTQTGGNTGKCVLDPLVKDRQL